MTDKEFLDKVREFTLMITKEVDVESSQAFMLMAKGSDGFGASSIHGKGSEIFSLLHHQAKDPKMLDLFGRVVRSYEVKDRIDDVSNIIKLAEEVANSMDDDNPEKARFFKIKEKFDNGDLPGALKEIDKQGDRDGDDTTGTPVLNMTPKGEA